jgi:hypothetical protein
MLCLLTLSAATVQASDQTIQGTGKVTTRTINITDYSAISLSGSMHFEYEQSNAAPFLSITVDENLFEYIRAEVKSGELIIAPKSEQENGSSYNLQPTVYKIKSNSKDLIKLSKAGSGNFFAKSALKISTLDIEQAGSGNVELEKEVTGNTLKVNAAGSGNFQAPGKIQTTNLLLELAGSGGIITKEVDLQSLKCSLAGSGSLTLLGRASKASYNLAGSGKIKALECKAEQASADLAGSGRIEVFATQKLTANCMGSGSIAYKGNPADIQKEKAGSGSIKAVD